MVDPLLLRNSIAEALLGFSRRGFSFDVGLWGSLDHKRKELIQAIEALKNARNTLSQQVAAVKHQGGDASLLIQEQQASSEKMKLIEHQLRETESEWEAFLAVVPNLPHESVPSGSGEKENSILKQWGTIPSLKDPKDHVVLGNALGILDLERASKISGARFSVLLGLGAKLERALGQWMLDFQSSNGYREIIPPYLVSAQSMFGTGQLPKFEHELFKVPHGDDFLYLIPTAEVPVTNLYRDEILPEASLPIRHCALTPCFRSEAGSYGKDTKGIIRQHQFHKVELVSFVTPDQGEQELETLTSHAEGILEALNLPYRRVLLCSGDMGFSSQKTYDLEVWLPSQNAYREISSCSWFGTFQARRANLKYRPQEPKAKAQYLHTLNGSGLAVGRTWVAVIENGQQPDGSIILPKVLHSYMGTDVIPMEL